MKRVLVTGGAGFIGRHLCSALAQHGCEVQVLDLVVPCSRDTNSSTRYLKGSVLDTVALDHALSLCPDIVVHMAAISLPGLARADPAGAVETNVEGTKRLLEKLASCHSVKRFVFVSSSMVYGNFLREPATEDHPNNPIETYGRTKLIGEQLTRLFCGSWDIPSVIVRPTAVYGPGDANRRVVQRLLEQALNGDTLTVDDDGSERLDFTHVADFTAGLALASLSPEAAGLDFNLSRGESFSVLELAQIIRELIPTSLIELRPRRQQERFRPQRGTLDISRAHKILGYNPQYSLRRGIAAYMQHLSIGLEMA